MRTRISAVGAVALLLLGLALALLTVRLVLGLISGSPMEGWKAWLLLGLLFFTAEQVSAWALPVAPRPRRGRRVLRLPRSA